LARAAWARSGARDTKLGREVAIKTLPRELAKDADRLVRFEREAKALAALNHANIAAVYGLDEHAFARPKSSTLTATDQRADVWAFGIVLFEMLT
jgi:serine/threonine protein kinase